MRFVVSFAHRKYLGLMDALSSEPDFELPLGVYRQIVVVVEAPDAESAVRAAEEELRYPDDEMDLAPMGVVAQDEARAAAQGARRARAAPRRGRRGGTAALRSSGRF